MSSFVLDKIYLFCNGVFIARASLDRTTSIEGLLRNTDGCRHCGGHSVVGVLFGSMLFLSFTVAPTVFRSLSTENAGVFLRRLLPGYCLWGLAIALLAASIAVGTSTAVSVALLLVALLSSSGKH